MPAAPSLSFWLLLQPTESALVHVDNLVEELEKWLHEGEPPTGGLEPGAEGGPRLSPSGSPRKLIFHTFSNTGWLTYGAVLQRLHRRHGAEATSVLIRGCVVDSAPVMRLDPEVCPVWLKPALCVTGRCVLVLSTPRHVCLAALGSPARLSSFLQTVPADFA